ncbi:MAG: acylphosphatase [Ekhidna sp.]|uniref:acylphosphatase n=1 Tax=Ekhidna sp. TaxID=2608089 RepID=UPI0032EE21AF
MIAYRIHVVGRVQGVFFRASTREKATSLGLKGWVMNQHDGSVLIEAEGEVDSLSKLIEWCKQGPPLSDVQNVDFELIPVVGHGNFEVAY